MPVSRQISTTVGLLCLLFSTSADAVTIRVTYDEVHDRVQPSPEVTHTAVNVTATLSESGTVSQDENRASGRAQRSTNKGLRLGRGDGKYRWRVMGADKLMQVEDYRSYARAILVTVTGGSCTAQVNYRLKAGFSDYQYHRLRTGENAVARSVTAGNLSCSVE